MLTRDKIAVSIALLLFLMSSFVLYDVTENSEVAWPIKKQNNIVRNVDYTITKPIEIRLTGKNEVSDEQNSDVIQNSHQNEINNNEVTSTVSSNGYLGKFRVTRYCPCEICNGKWAANNKIDTNGNIIAYGASGNRLNSGYSCAADTSLPFGTKLYIPQIDMTVTVEDRAAKSIEQRYNGKFVDLYFSDHGHYIEGASDYMEVYIVE